MASGHSGAKNSKNWRFYLYLLILLSLSLEYCYPYFIIIFIFIAKETHGCRWAQVIIKPKTARIGDCILTFSLFPHNLILSYLNHYLYPYYKENWRVQVGSGHSGAKNRKNWKFLPRSVVDMWQRSRRGHFLERLSSFLFVFYLTQVRLLLCVVLETLHNVVEFCSNWICQNWHMVFPE